MTKPYKHTFTFSERWAIFQAYNQICIYCHNIVEWKDFEVDHILNESLLKDTDKLEAVIQNYELDQDFSINSFPNWACSHHSCNRIKSDTTFDKSRAFHFLTIAKPKSLIAKRIFQSLEKGTQVNKIKAQLRILIEKGIVTQQEIIAYVNAIVNNAVVGINNPDVVCFGLCLEDVYKNFPADAPESTPYIYDWLEAELTKQLYAKLNCTITQLEDERNVETLSVRYAIWDLDYSILDSLDLIWWEILELSLHTEIYDEFVQDDS